MRTIVKKPDAKGPAMFTDVLEYIREKKGNREPPRKVDLAHDVCELLTKQMLEATSNLKDQLQKVATLIRKWNRLPEPEQQ